MKYEWVFASGQSTVPLCKFAPLYFFLRCFYFWIFFEQMQETSPAENCISQRRSWGSLLYAICNFLHHLHFWGAFFSFLSFIHAVFGWTGREHNFFLLNRQKNVTFGGPGCTINCSEDIELWGRESPREITPGILSREPVRARHHLTVGMRVGRAEEGVRTKQISHWSHIFSP